jgi:hypothetical protein
MYVMICKLGNRQEHIHVHVYYDYTKLNTKYIVSIFCYLGITYCLLLEMF